MNGDGVHDGVAATPTVPIAGQPGFIDGNGDGIHDVPATPAPAGDADEKEQEPVYDKGGNLVTE
ncbi:hypothetical protein FQV26_11175 [Planococcus sp. CPCC 101016]|nr:hypothetical protein FQV26_11175 [Planococcus sp. CPCC 101016]